MDAEIRYGRLVVLGEHHVFKIGKCCNVLCDCGVKKTVYKKYLLDRRVVSCGCHGRTVNIKHKGARTKLFKVWTAMKQRCENANDPAYKNYGGRGIAVSDEWHDFAKFKEDMGEQASGVTIERIDNDLGYSKENCRWASWKDQGQNKRNNVWIETPKGRLLIGDAAEKYGLNKHTLYSRIVRKGWPIGIALTTPSDRAASKKISNNLREKGLIYKTPPRSSRRQPSKSVATTRKEK